MSKTLRDRLAPLRCWFTRRHRIEWRDQGSRGYGLFFDARWQGKCSRCGAQFWDNSKRKPTWN